MGDKYLDRNLAPEERAKALLKEMTIAEKLAQLGSIFPFMEGWDDFEKIADQTKNGIEQVSTLQMRDMHTREACCAWQRKIQKIVTDNSPHGIPAAFIRQAARLGKP